MTNATHITMTSIANAQKSAQPVERAHDVGSPVLSRSNKPGVVHWTNGVRFVVDWSDGWKSEHYADELTFLIAR